jgi:hypothetical protein
MLAQRDFVPEGSATAKALDYSLAGVAASLVTVAGDVATEVNGVVPRAKMLPVRGAALLGWAGFTKLRLI